MKIIKASYQIIGTDLDDPKTKYDIYKKIEQAGRTCYKSEDKITEESCIGFVKAMVRNGHEAMLEHASMSVKFVVDRGVSHELVRHRLCSFAQESTRYCNYSKDKFGNEITVIEPCFFWDISEDDKLMYRNVFDKWSDDSNLNVTPKGLQYARWYSTCKCCEASYFKMLEYGATPQEARSVLPTSLKTEIVVTADMREWRNIFKLRAAGEHGVPHPQMLEVMIPLLNECKLKLPELFSDIEAMEVGEYDYPY